MKTTKKDKNLVTPFSKTQLQEPKSKNRTPEKRGERERGRADEEKSKHTMKVEKSRVLL